MPQLATIALEDGASTPVSHDFIPRDIVGGVATFIESTGVPLGDRRITVSLNVTAQGRYKPILKFTLPVVQDNVVNGVARPTVVRTAYADLTFSFDPASSLQERKDMVALVRNALAFDKSISSVPVNLEALF